MPKRQQAVPDFGADLREIDRRLSTLESSFVHPVTAASGYDLLPKGDQWIHGPLTSGSSVYSSTSIEDTDFVISSKDVKAGRWYLAHVHSQTTMGILSSSSNEILELDVSGTVVGRLHRHQSPTGTFGIMLNGFARYVPAADATVTFKVRHQSSGGSTNLQFNASSTTPRWFTVYDMGVAPA